LIVVVRSANLRWIAERSTTIEQRYFQVGTGPRTSVLLGNSTMPISTACPQCNQGLRVPDTALGKSVRCPKCQTVFKVEAEAAPPPAADPFGLGPLGSGGGANNPFDFLGSPNTSSSPPPKPKNDPFASLGGPPPGGMNVNPYAPPAAPSYAAAGSGGDGLPWERKKASDTFLETIKLVMLEPNRAFGMMRVSGDIGGPVLFLMAGVFVGSIGILIWTGR
jgi:hypothetical protein